MLQHFYKKSSRVFMKQEGIKAPTCHCSLHRFGQVSWHIYGDPGVNAVGALAYASESAQKPGAPRGFQ